MNCCYERCVERIYHVLRNGATLSVDGYIAHCLLCAGESPMVRFYQCMFVDNYSFDFPGRSPYDYLLNK